MYYIKYTARGTKCVYSNIEYKKLTDKEKDNVEKLCKNLKAKLILI